MPYDEILSGGPGKDGIPAIDDPHITVSPERQAIAEAAEMPVMVQHSWPGMSGEFIVWASHPAIVDGRIVIRDGARLAVYRLRAAE